MKEHGEEEMDAPVVCVEFEVVYVSSLAKFLRVVMAGRYPEDWPGYCMLPWHRQTLPFLEGSKVWGSATKFGRPRRTESGGFFFVGWHSREFFSVPPEERRRLYFAAPTS